MEKKIKLLLLHGPNLNMLGQRKPEVYGVESLKDIEARLAAAALAHGVELSCFQSNSEGEIISRIHQARDNEDGLIVNAGAYSHTSLAIRDALECCERPFVEVHISNIYAREPFRHHSMISALAAGVICGCGTQGYLFALERLVRILS
ncbi:MAG: type II 3-dehydroquinate dehydratase [bacterium]|nr:type II 3-dehydroquinate dehydratase [bacterium]